MQFVHADPFLVSCKVVVWTPKSIGLKSRVDSRIVRWPHSVIRGTLHRVFWNDTCKCYQALVWLVARTVSHMRYQLVSSPSLSCGRHFLLTPGAVAMERFASSANPQFRGSSPQASRAVAHDEAHVSFT